jgi:hypothetical protein
LSVQSDLRAINFKDSKCENQRHARIAMVQAGGTKAAAKSEQKPIFISISEHGGANPSLSAKSPQKPSKLRKKP